ncbi:hypothetical protein EVAR_11108_1 [Eumeta japonica]|uniref:Uncharacterized protein n=1 Tax=Eumeta variegata TaxID=151549 RepID=A0A4C1U4M7_EUMVA|nr:hypothetical protein EVAR_11108_1 [Eumeta japonica]
MSIAQGRILGRDHEGHDPPGLGLRLTIVIELEPAQAAPRIRITKFRGVPHIRYERKISFLKAVSGPSRAAATRDALLPGAAADGGAGTRAVNNFITQSLRGRCLFAVVRARS